MRLSDEGRYLESQQFARSALEQARAFGPDSMRLGYAADQLGLVEQSLGQYLSAEDAYKRAIDLDARYADADYLTNQPLWTPFLVSRARSILRRINNP